MHDSETTTPERGGIPRHTQIFIGLVLGAACGALAQASFGHDHPGVLWLVRNVAQPLGQVFLRLIFMIVVPLLVSALILGVAEIGDARKVGRVGARSLLLTLLLSSLAVGLALVLVNVIQPGAGIDPARRDELMAVYGAPAAARESVANAERAKPFVQALVEIIPRNPLAEAVNALDGGLLSVMFFALVFGIAMASVDRTVVAPLKQVLESVLAVSLRVIDMVMRIAPVGVFGLMFSTSAVLGLDALLALGKYVFVVLLALALHQFVTYSLAIRFIAGRDPRKFFADIRTVMLTAFATSSSNATLPTALRAATDNLHLPRDISTFVLTVGATANQNGTALFEGITVIFLAQFFGIPLTIEQQVTVLVMAIVAGIGTAGVPGGSWPMIAIILKSVGVPPEAIGLCLGIDRILDMSRTVLNVSGDLTIATCVAALDERHRATETPAPPARE
jgi:DAACS family dicarboxylate/amino acid:cation (Na+ or H+) symporter